ncbi:MAG: hypothetical protein ACK559_03725, partial [bacterium]
YETYLKWLFQSPIDVDSGKSVLDVIFAKEHPQEQYRGSAQHDENASADLPSLQATRILRKFWDQVVLGATGIVSASLESYSKMVVN